MVNPYLIQPDQYTNAMIKGLSTNLAYIAESKKGGGNIMRGGGGGKEKLSGPQQAVEDSRILQENLAKENKERNEKYKERQAAEDKENLMAERQEKESVAKVQKDEATAKKDTLEYVMSFVPAVTQGNYRDYFSFVGEQGLDTALYAHPDKVEAMKPEEFAAYKVGLGEDKKDATGKSLGRYEQEKKIAQKIEQENKRYERTLASGEKRAEMAKDFILRVAAKNKTGIADVLAMKLLGGEIDKDALAQVKDSVPEELKGAYDNAVKIVSDYYKTDTPPVPVGGSPAPPKGFADTGRLDINGNKVYSDGVNAWIQPTQ